MNSRAIHVIENKHENNSLLNTILLARCSIKLFKKSSKNLRDTTVVLFTTTSSPLYSRPNPVVKMSNSSKQQQQTKKKEQRRNEHKEQKWKRTK